MRTLLHLLNPTVRFSMFFSKHPSVAFKTRVDKFKNSCLTVFCAALISACNGEAPQAASKQFSEVPKPSSKLVDTTSCDSSTLLSRSPHFAEFESIAVDTGPFVSKFSKYIDIEGQEVTKFQRKDGLRVYEASPVIIPLIYEGSWKTYRREQSIFAKKTGSIAYSKRGLRYYWEAGAFVKDSASKMYSMKPSKFKVFLSHEFKIPEWHAEGDITDWQRTRWDYLSCRTALHERTHAEITREHILGTIEEILNLKAQTSDELKESIRKTWKYKLAELRVKQKFFDAETKQKRRQQALNR